MRSMWPILALSLAVLIPALPAQAQDDEPLFDDTWLVIDLENEVRSRSGRQPSEVHYKPRFRIRFFGAEDGDAVKIRWKKGRRTLAEIRCPLQAQYGYHRTELSQRCWTQSGVELDAHGDLSVDVIFVDDSEDEETLMRTLEVPVGRYWAWDRRVGNRNVHSPRYQVRGDDLLGLSYAWLRPPSSTEARGQVYFYFWATLPNGDTNFRDPSWRCSLDGERVPDLNVGRDVVESLADMRVTDDRMNGRERESTHYAWHLMWVKPQMVWGERNPQVSSTASNSRYNISEHPGEYVCQLRNNGEMVRQLSFTVTGEGTIAPHPAQTEGDLSLRPGAYFVEATFPDRNPVETSFNRDAVRSSVAFGREWPNHPQVRQWLQSLPRSFGEGEPRPPRGAR